MCLAVLRVTRGAALRAVCPSRGADSSYPRVVFSSHSAGADPTVAGCAMRGRAPRLEA